LLVSIKRLTVTDWYLSVILPVDEAFGPISDMQGRFWLVASFLTLLAGTLTWWMLRRQLKPLRQAIRTLALQESAHLPMKPLPVSGADEIAQLISSFNSLLATLREREQKLTSSEARLRTLSEMSSDFFWETDAEHRVVLHSASDPRADGARAILSMPMGARRWDVPSVSPDESGWQVHREILEAHKPFRNFEISRALPNGSVHHVSVSGNPAFDAQGRFTGYLGIGTDVTQAKEAQFQIQSLAFYDPLTGLPNRRLLMDRLKVAIANLVRHQHRGALLFVDLDNFKKLNDTLGHEAGDLLLKQVAAGLTACIREGDTVARLGGDEFVVMLEDLSARGQDAHTQAEIVAQKILQTLNQSYQLGDAERRVTPSIGVTLFGDVLESVDEPLKRADLAMYKAKGAGRNTVQFFEQQP
jgi:diguanylate cyclase (GGDEF)-like protein